MKFKKKPIIIEAEQWFAGKEIEGVEEKIEYVIGCACKTYFVNTLEGNMKVSDGDWIITGVNGEKYPCKPDIFEKTYECCES
ncbi:MAG: hypothetical protein ACYC0F_18560 [Rhodanobacter sp.]